MSLTIKNYIKELKNNDLQSEDKNNFDKLILNILNNFLDELELDIKEKIVHRLKIIFKEDIFAYINKEISYKVVRKIKEEIYK